MAHHSRFMIIVLTLWLSAVSLGPAPAQAIPLTWNVFGGLQKEDPLLGTLTTTFSGSFVFDYDLTAGSSNPILCDVSCFSSVNIDVGAFTLAVPTVSFNGQLVAANSFFAGAPVIAFSTVPGSFTNAGGTFALDTGAPGLGLCATAACTSLTDTWIVTGGTVSASPVGAVPEPASLLLLGSGLAGLVAWRRRKG